MMKLIENLQKTMSSFETIKIYGANTLAFLSTFSTIDAILKITLVMVSIAYTVVKIWKLIKDDRTRPNNEDK
jgi:hypothetical protein